jgi:hypothetical protein
MTFVLLEYNNYNSMYLEDALQITDEPCWARQDYYGSCEVLVAQLGRKEF